MTFSSAFRVEAQLRALVLPQAHRVYETRQVLDRPPL